MDGLMLSFSIEHNSCVLARHQHCFSMYSVSFSCLRTKEQGVVGEQGIVGLVILNVSSNFLCQTHLLQLPTILYNCRGSFSIPLNNSLQKLQHCIPSLFRVIKTTLSSSYNISGLVPVCWLLFQCF